MSTTKKAATFTRVDCLTILRGQQYTLNSLCSDRLLIYIVEGTGWLSHFDVVEELKGGMTKLVRTSEVITAVSKLTIYKLDMGEDLLSSLTITDGFCFAEVAQVKILPTWKELLKLQQATSISEKCRYYQLIWSLFEVVTDQSAVDGIEEVAIYIKQHLYESVSIGELSMKVGMTPTSFTRAFKKKMNLTPKEYMNKERVRRSKELLIQGTDMTLKEIAHQIGLQDEFYFSRFFKKHVGIPPAEFIKRREKKVAVVSQLFLQDCLVALGIQPVAAPAYPTTYPLTKGIPSYLVEELEGTYLLNAEKPFNRDEIIQSHPDVIIKTVLHPSNEQSSLWTQQTNLISIPQHSNWEGYLKELALLFGMEYKVKRIIGEIEQLEDNLKRCLSSKMRNGEWVIIWIRENEIRLYGRNHHAFVQFFYQTLGFTPHPSVPESYYVTISLEELCNINPDYILILWSHECDVQKITSTEQWKRLKASEQKKVFFPNSLEWDPWGPLGRKHMIHDFYQFFTKHVE
ncbi:AraC family transcriptional regulator [Bacillus suaedaesalsae]|uniref:AraC family transcriptional regulator n=1 Tax=Bacillus suaedaesalsae TaxID=2810349 RepID=A0ABS2DN86_9BACI|nr:AraC family transcriptional regulator [Bacillus suaedaesalsae]MBM6618941.1 AraC family transcriptional regulator [Bacillus suaedaesalsae]